VEITEVLMGTVHYPLIRFTDETGSQFGVMSGALYIKDVLSQDQCFLAFEGQGNFGYYQFTPSTKVLEVFDFSQIKYNLPVSIYSLIVTAGVDSALKPKADNMYDLGYHHALPFLQRYWRNIYFKGELKGGDITMADDRFIKVGRDSDGVLPNPTSNFRGKMIIVEGVTGATDKVCVCIKKADDTYGWFDLISGTFVA
jgi:hypothetical protein